MGFPTINEVEEIIKNNNLKIIEVEESPRGDYRLNDEREDAIQELCSIAIDNGIKTMFLKSETLKGEELEEILINEETITLDEYGERYKDILKNVKRHNDNIKKMASSGCYEMILSVPINGIIFAIWFLQDWFTNLPDPQETLDKITSGYEEEIQQLREVKARQEDALDEELIQLLVQDEEFKYETSRSRRYYASEIFGKRYPGKYKSLLEIDALAKEAQNRIKKANQLDLEKLVAIVIEDETFKNCYKKSTKIAYLNSILPKYTDKVLMKTEVEQIAELAWLKLGN
ncbi:hypothetical protein [Pelosinus propionicus]|uniref:Uncharacterized protein n=1 Tax=Pelosinus propionicus DSM 13327 TaxID=1123291 RepID=A0A1I4JVD3_9FIRM|nr:hypothetical protein [Pelosinus propionicus]SFL70167.1 hypothetical protein SAMN04490355_101430 [Pelosinus propionicus DSM 13327]